MEHDFVATILEAIWTPGRGIVLGCKRDGQICVESLANAFDRISADRWIHTVLVEGFGETGAPSPSLAPYVSKLRSAGVTVEGIETADTERGIRELEAAMNQMAHASSADDREAADAILQAQNVATLNQRLKNANAPWADKLRAAARPVILCCGAAHLPDFRTDGVAGLVSILGSDYKAFAVLDDVQASDLYTPEPNRPGAFGSVPWIHAVR